jgi:hypothetical protein
MIPRTTLGIQFRFSLLALSLSFPVVEKPVARTSVYIFIYLCINTYIFIYIHIYTRLHTFRAYFRFQKISRIHHHCK